MGKPGADGGKQRADGQRRYTVGQIAKICNVSAEQLRHYDRQHILSPKGRGENGYRYYTEQQIEDIMLIKELKRAGLPLKSIGSLLEDKSLEQIKATLESTMLVQRRQLYEQMKRYDSLVDTLLRLGHALSLISLSSGENSAVPAQGFSIVPIAERPILSTRYRSSCSVNDPFLYRYAELQKIAETEQVSTSATRFLVFHDHYRRQFQDGGDAAGDLELFMNVTGSVPQTGHCRMFGGFLAACATHVGHYRYTQPLYEELAAWAEGIGYSVSGISFQELIVGRTLTNREENFVTKIYLPLNVSDI